MKNYVTGDAVTRRGLLAGAMRKAGVHWSWLGYSKGGGRRGWYIKMPMPWANEVVWLGSTTTHALARIKLLGTDLLPKRGPVEFPEVQ